MNRPKQTCCHMTASHLFERSEVHVCKQGEQHCDCPLVPEPMSQGEGGAHLARQHVTRVCFTGLAFKPQIGAIITKH